MSETADDGCMRIEAMCRQSGQQLLLSSDFVGEGGIAARSLGHHELKRVGADQELFVPISPAVRPG